MYQDLMQDWKLRKPAVNSLIPLKEQMAIDRSARMCHWTQRIGKSQTFGLSMDKVGMLIQILLNRMGEIGERDDAAMDLAMFFDDDRALDALAKVGSNPSEEEFIQDTCGESIAEILLHRNTLRKDILDTLNPNTRAAAYRFISAAKPEWRISSP